MAIQPDPVGAFTATFSAADTSNRDWQRIDMMKRTQEEAAIQRARENKANDFKMMMTALGRRDRMKQQGITNQLNAYQRETSRYQANVQSYRAQNPSSRSQANMLDVGPPGSESMPVPPADGGQQPGIPPLPMGNPMAGSGGLDEGLVNTIKGFESFIPNAYGDYKQTSIGYGTRARSSNEVLSKEEADARLREELGAHAARVDSAAQQAGVNLSANQRNALISFDFNTGKGGHLLETSNGNLDEVKRRLLLYNKAGGQELKGLVNRRNQEAQLFSMPDAGTAPGVPQPVAAEPPNFSVTTSAQFPSTPTTYNDALLAPLPTTAQAEMPPPVAAAPRPIDEFVGPPAVPEFGSANIESAGRQQLSQMEAAAAQSEIGMEQARLQQANAMRMLSNRYLPEHRRPEWQEYLIKQQMEERKLSRESANAQVEAAQKKTQLKVTADLQGKLNTLTGLNDVIPREDRQRLIEEATNPGTANLAENKIKTLGEYSSFRQLNEQVFRRPDGQTYASNGYRTAEQVVVAAREMQDNAYIKAKNEAEERAAYQKEIADKPDMPTDVKEKLTAKIAELTPATVFTKLKEDRLSAALKADIKLPPKDDVPVKASDIRVDVPTAAPATIDRSTGQGFTKTAADGIKDLEKTEANAYWGQNSNYVAQQVFMDGGKDESGKVIPPMSVAELEAIVSGKGAASGVTPYSMGGQGGVSRSPGPSFADKLLQERMPGWKPSDGDPAKWGRKTQPTPQDFLKAAAKERLAKLKEPKAMDTNVKSAADEVLKKYKLGP